MIIIYFLIALGATTVGAISGLGGGIIIKPLLDILGDYDVRTISVLSSVTVLSMSIVSVGKNFLRKTEINLKIAIPLAIGGAAGGFAGQRLLSAIVKALDAGSTITIIQNVILLLLVVVVFLYMRRRDKIKGPNLTGAAGAVIAGLSLGLVSSFLGIGGGPINVALLIFLFGFDIKTSTVCSLVIILFSQITNVASTAITTGFSQFDLTVLPMMVVGAVLGGFIGSSLNRKMSDKAVGVCFNCVQLLVCVFAIFNIAKLL